MTKVVLLSLHNGLLSENNELNEAAVEKLLQLKDSSGLETIQFHLFMPREGDLPLGLRSSDKRFRKNQFNIIANLKEQLEAQDILISSVMLPGDASIHEAVASEKTQYPNYFQDIEEQSIPGRVWKYIGEPLHSETIKFTLDSRNREDDVDEVIEDDFIDYFRSATTLDSVDLETRDVVHTMNGKALAALFESIKDLSEVTIGYADEELIESVKDLVSSYNDTYGKHIEFKGPLYLDVNDEPEDDVISEREEAIELDSEITEENVHEDEKGLKRKQDEENLEAEGLEEIEEESQDPNLAQPCRDKSELIARLRVEAGRIEGGYKFGIATGGIYNRLLSGATVKSRQLNALADAIENDAYPVTGNVNYFVTRRYDIKRKASILPLRRVNESSISVEDVAKGHRHGWLDWLLGRKAAATMTEKHLGLASLPSQ